MNEKNLIALKQYKETVFEYKHILSFWKNFIENSMAEFKTKNPEKDNLYSAIFATYDLDHQTNSGYLKVGDEAFKISVHDMNIHKDRFFSWVMNLSLIKAYNALELFILKTISYQYFPSLSNQANDKKSVDQLQKEIKKYLKEKGIEFSTKNNKHLITFLKISSPEFKIFIEQKMNIDLETTWENFFELFSILRNGIAHQDMLFSYDSENEIKSKAKDIFDRHFKLHKQEFGNLDLVPDENQFSNFIDLTSRFGLNTAKFISNERELSFLGMK